MTKTGESIFDNSFGENLIQRINGDSLTENLWGLVQVPSPTGNERNAAMLFAELLESAGAQVKIDETLQDSPNIIGRLKGCRKGNTLQLAGHLDHIDIPHDAPKRDGDSISGRGSADMKNGLAGIIEIIRILNETGRDFPGEILVTAYGMHEAPTGNSQGLNALIDNGILGDAAIVCEGPDDAAAIMANGMAIWEINIKLNQPVCHELCVKVNRPDLLEIALTVNDVLKCKGTELSKERNQFPLLNAESVFMGQMHYGDFYNRVPNHVFLQGTHRWHPDKVFDNIIKTFELMLSEVVLPQSVSIETVWKLVGESYQIQPDEMIVRSLIDAFQKVFRRKCPIKGHSSVTDTCRLVRRGGIPAVLFGFGTNTGHADYEFVTIEQLKKSCAVALLTTLNYLNATAKE